MAEISLGNGFSIDIADAQKFVQALDDRLKSLQNTYFTHAQNLYVPAPGHDAVSGDYAARATASIDSYKTWNVDQQNTLKGLINQVNAVVTNYQQTDQHNTMRS